MNSNTRQGSDFFQERQYGVSFAAFEGHRPVLDADDRPLEVLVAQNKVIMLVARFHSLQDREELLKDILSCFFTL